MKTIKFEVGDLICNRRALSLKNVLGIGNVGIIVSQNDKTKLFTIQWFGCDKQQYRCGILYREYSSKLLTKRIISNNWTHHS